jgi:uncharacterized membrane protein YfcA
MSGFFAHFPVDFAFYFIGLPTVFIIAMSKGAFGGGLAILGVPLLSLVMSPIDAAIVVAPLVSLMDLLAIGSFGPKTWAKKDLVWILPALVVGIALGYIFFTRVDPHLVEASIALVTLLFTAYWFLRGRRAKPSHIPLSPLLASAAGVASGFTTFVAHAGGPPVNMYLLKRGLDKSVYTGTNLIIFMLGNLIKLLPYGVLAYARPSTLFAALALSPAAPFGVWLGVHLHHRLEQNRLYFWCYMLLAAAASKLLFDALHALLV